MSVRALELAVRVQQSPAVLRRLPALMTPEKVRACGGRQSLPFQLMCAVLAAPPRATRESRTKKVPYVTFWLAGMHLSC